MIHTRRVALLAAVCALTPLLAGCASGLDASTSREHTSVQGGAASASQIELEDVYLEPASAAIVAHPSSAPHPSATDTTAYNGFLVVVVANNTGTSVSLTGVSVAGGGSVTPSPPGNLSVPAGGTLSFVDPVTGQHGHLLLLRGSSTPLTAGTLLRATFQFSSGVSVSAQVPVFVNPWPTSIASAVPTP